MASASRAETSSTPSLRASIAESVRSEILSGALVPGTRISTADLQERFDASLGAVREALLQLAADNLAISIDRRGFRVAPVSIADLEDLASARVEIETFTLRDAMARSTSASEGEILAALHRLSEISRHHDGSLTDAWYEEHRVFHATLVAASQANWIGRFRVTLHDQFERYCRISQLLRRSTTAKERSSHQVLAEAVLSRDVERACEVMSEHVWGTVRVILASSKIAKT